MLCKFHNNFILSIAKTKPILKNINFRKSIYLKLISRFDI